MKKTLCLEGIQKGYHLSMEGIRKENLFSAKNSGKKGKGLDLGAGPPHIKLLFFVLTPSSIEDIMFTKRLSLTLCNEHLCLRLISVGRP